MTLRERGPALVLDGPLGSGDGGAPCWLWWQRIPAGGAEDLTHLARQVLPSPEAALMSRRWGRVGVLETQRAGQAAGGRQRCGASLFPPGASMGLGLPSSSTPPALARLSPAAVGGL